MGIKVLFDHQLFSYQRFGGASKYFAMLINSMPRDSWETTTWLSNNTYVDAVDLFKHRRFLPNLFFRGQGRIMNELNKPYSIYKIHKGDFDVFHQTHFEPYCLKPLGTKPMVTTFHDINFSTLNPNPKVVKHQKLSLQRADKIISISECTKKDMLNLFDIDEDKVTVIHHGIEIPKKKGNYLPLLSVPYILYVGTRGKHKNFNNFVKAFAVFHQRFPEIKLVCTFKPFTAEELELFKTLGLSESVVQISANEDEMNSLYQHALFFVFPSLYEGFGMPILEAWINDCPVVLSDASCFPEIAGDAGLYFNPTEIDDMAEKLELMTNDSVLREDYRQRGINRVKEFSWKKCAQKHMDVYKSLL